MNAKEVQSALDDFRKQVGPKADISIFVRPSESGGEKAAYASLHPFGMATSMGYLWAEADDFAEAIDLLKGKWAEHAKEHERQTVRDMALAIIRITNDFGSCTDAALRAEFDAGSVARWGDEACEEADRMAANGPFTIKRMKGANAA